MNKKEAVVAVSKLSDISKKSFLNYAAFFKKRSKKTMTANTNSIWMNAPAICKANPPNHMMSKITAMISIIPILFTSFFLFCNVLIYG